MSIENVGKFFELVKTNEDLARKIAKIKNENQNKGEAVDYEQIIIKKIIPLAKKLGLDFNLENFLSYTNTLAQQGELSDDDLLNVSGGMSAKQGLAMLGIILTLTPIASGFMGRSAVAETGEQQGPSNPTSSYCTNVNSNIDTPSQNSHGAENENNSITDAGDNLLNASSNDEQQAAGEFNGNTKVDAEKGPENSKSAKPSADLATFNMSENKHEAVKKENANPNNEKNTIETAENKEETQAEAKVNVGTEKKTDDTEAKDDSLEDTKSDVSTEDTASGTTTTNDAKKAVDLATAAGSATKSAAKSDTKTATETTAEAATATNSVKLSLNTLKEAVNYIFGGNIDESKTPSTSTYGDGIEIIYGWDQNNKPFALNSDGVVFSYNNGTASLTLQQKLSSDKILELNNAESAAEEAASKAKAEAAAEEATKPESETESNTDEVATADDSASETIESSKAEEKYFYSASQFSSWKDNGDGTVTAVDEDGETHIFSKHNKIKEGSTQKEQLANLANTIHNLKENSLNNLWPEDRVDFEEDLGNFIRNHWNAKTGKFEVDGVSNEDPNIQIIENHCKDPTEFKVGFTASDNLVDTINRINSTADLESGDLGQKPFMIAIKKVVCSKQYNTPNGTLKESLSGASQDGIDEFKAVEDFYNNKISNYDKSEIYFKLDSKQSENKEEELTNWLKTANKILTLNDINVGRDNFIRDGREIAASVKYNYENGKISYKISGVPQNKVDNFVKAFDLLLSNNVEYNSTNSNNPEELRAILEKVFYYDAKANILNIQKENRVQLIEDWLKLEEMENQNNNEEEIGEDFRSDELTAPKGKAEQKPEALNQTSEKELLGQESVVTDKTERKNASKAQGDQNAALSESEEVQNSQNEARNHVDASNAETAQNGQNVTQKEAEELQSSQSGAQENVNVSNTAASAQSNQAKVDFAPLGGFGSTLRNMIPTWLGGKSIEEQQLDHLINFIEENGISGRDQVSAPTVMSYLAAINEVGARIAVSRNVTEEREKIYYFNGEVQDSSHSAAFATILRDFENLSNNN